MIGIIDYTDQYQQQVIDLILDVYEKELGFSGYDRPDIYRITEIYQKKHGSAFWIALDTDEVIGTVGILEDTSEVAFLKRMVVKKEYRKKGVGKALLNRAINFAKEHGYCKMYAGTIEQNPNAIAFYEHLGFKRSQETPKAITAADDSICLELDLQSH